MSARAVVDTNVLLVANRCHEAASPSCVANCAKALQRISDDQRKLVIDNRLEIVREYQKKLNPRRPGVGDAFLKWVLTNHANPLRIEKAEIHACDDQRGYEEFPGNAELADFDPADRKFVALSRAHNKHPPVLQALDSKWVGWENDLAKEGVVVEHLCWADASAIFTKKFPKSSAQDT